MPFASEIAGVRRIVSELPRTIQGTLTAIGFSLVGHQKQHFTQLSKTGASNGVAWPRLAESTLAKRRALQRRGLLANADPEQIGFLSGRLSKSFRFSSNSVDQVRLTNVDTAAGIFAQRRPLYPSTIPAPWLASAESITQRRIDRLTDSL
jgi:hypothetical protein